MRLSNDIHLNALILDFSCSIANGRITLVSTPFCFIAKWLLIEFNAMVGVGLIGGVKRKFFDQFGRVRSNFSDQFKIVRSNSSKHIGEVRGNSYNMIGGDSPNSRDIIVYQNER